MMSYSSNMSVWLCWVLWALFYQSAMAQVHLCGRRLADTLDTLCAGRGFHMGKRNGRSTGSVYGKNTDNTDDSRGSSIHNFIDDIHHPQYRHIHDDNNFIGAAAATATAARIPGGPAAVANHRDSSSSYAKQKRKELVNFLSNVGITRHYNYTEDFLRRQAADFKGDNFYNDGDDDENTQSRDVLLGGRSLGIPSGYRSERRRRRRHAPVMSIVEECCIRRCGLPALLSYCAAPGEQEERIPDHILWSLFQVTPPIPRATQHPQDITLHPPAQINRQPETQTQFFWLRPENQVTRAPLIVNNGQS